MNLILTCSLIRAGWPVEAGCISCQRLVLWWLIHDSGPYCPIHIRLSPGLAQPSLPAQPLSQTRGIIEIWLGTWWGRARASLHWSHDHLVHNPPGPGVGCLQPLFSPRVWPRARVTPCVITDENISLGAEVRCWIWQAAIRILRFAHSSCTVVWKTDECISLGIYANSRP